MSRWIDADELIRYGKRGTLVYWEDIEDAPSIDIVRCKECKFADAYKTISGEWRFYCMESGVGGRKNDDFCSYGESEVRDE